ncbi:MAG: hypothetical protein R2795_09980 [Saprospiraceae bacterium]
MKFMTSTGYLLEKIRSGQPYTPKLLALGGIYMRTLNALLKNIKQVLLLPIPYEVGDSCIHPVAGTGVVAYIQGEAGDELYVPFRRISMPSQYKSKPTTLSLAK